MGRGCYEETREEKIFKLLKTYEGDTNEVMNILREDLAAARRKYFADKIANNRAKALEKTKVCFLNIFKNFLKQPSKKNLEHFLSKMEIANRKLNFLDSGFMGLMEQKFSNFDLIRDAEGFEYEIKLDGNDCIQGIGRLNQFSWQLLKKGILVSPYTTNIASSVNYFGDENKESYAINFNSLSGNRFKKKGESQSINGDDFEGKEFISKRLESIKDTNKDKVGVLRRTLDKALYGIENQGVLFRGRRSSKLISLKTGRAYAVVVDECSIPGIKLNDGEKLKQLEIEYVGIFPKLAQSREFDEIDMCKELIEIGNLCKMYIPNIEFSTVKKYDWFMNVKRKYKNE